MTGAGIFINLVHIFSILSILKSRIRPANTQPGDEYLTALGVQTFISALSGQMLFSVSPDLFCRLFSVPHIPCKYTAIKNAMKEYLSQHTKKDSPVALTLPMTVSKLGDEPQRIKNPMLKRYPT